MKYAAAFWATCVLSVALLLPACAQSGEDAQAHRTAIEAFYPVMIQAVNDGNFDQARSLIAQAIEWEPEEPVHWYNLACIEARAGRTEEALEALDQSVALGYADAAGMTQDPDLTSLHGYEQFQRLVAVAAENAGVAGHAASTAQAPAPAAAPPGATGTGVGMRVRTGCYGTMTEGVIEQVDAGRYFVRFPANESSCDGWRDADQIQVLAPEPGQGGSYTAGAPIEARLNGNWQAAVVLRAEGGQHFVHYENYSAAMDAWVGPADIRQTPERARHRTGTGGTVPPGTYECYNFSGGSLLYQTEFTVTGNGTYRDIEGTRGMFTKDAQGIVRFQGGAFNGSQGDFQYNYGRPYVYMHTPDRPGERAGMDCEGPTP